VQQHPDYQAGHWFGMTPFYWMTRTASNTDYVGQLSYSAVTTSSYSFLGLYAATPVCTISPVSPGATTFTITTLTNTTLTVTASAAFTGSVNYLCVGRY
jgi:hypothetical protein